MELGIKNKSVLVSAGSKGLGKAAAKTFAFEGCKEDGLKKYLEFWIALLKQ